MIREHDPREKRRVGDSQEGKGLERPLQRGGMRVIMGEKVEEVAEELPKEKQHQEIRA